MDLVQWLKNRWQSPAAHYTYFWIPPGNVQMPAGQALDPAPLKAGQHYFRLWLTEMFLKNDRDWGSSWYPAVLSSVHLKFGNQTVEIAQVAGESSLKNFDLKALNKGDSVNHQLTDLLPFNGGTVHLEAALVAMQGKSDLKSLLKVLGDFSKLMVVPQLSSALAVASPLADGIAELVGATNAHPELRLEDTWSGDGSGNTSLLRAGYFVVLSAKEGEVLPAALSVKDNHLYRGANQFTGYHYMLFRLDATDQRDDWEALNSINGPYQDALNMLETIIKTDDPELKKKLKAEADKRIALAKLAAVRAPELTSVVGRNQVVEALNRRWEEARKNVGEGAFSPEFPRTLRAAMRNPMPVAQAMEKGELTEEDLWRA